jgi:cysteine desulfurase / selenocysteine lyase
MTIDQFKSHFYSGSEFTHFNNSGQALIPITNKLLATKWLNRLYEEGGLCSVEGWAQTEVTRKKLAHFIGAEVSEISFFTTTSSAISQAAMGIPLKANDEILTWEQEYPSNFYPWRMASERTGAKVIQIESQNYETPVSAILDKVTDKTKVIAVSWVQYQTGSVTDLKALSEKLKGSGIWLVADVIQGAGVRPVNFHDTDFDILCSGSHKFMCSSYGAGFMALKKDRMPELTPIEVGAMTYGTPDTKKSFSNEPKKDGARYEPGSKCMVEVIAMGATLDLFTQVGTENIYNEATRIAKKLADGLRDRKFKVIMPEGPILNFTSQDPNDLESYAKKLVNAQVSFAKRGPGIRLSAHGYNTDEQVERVLKVLS